jgi:uncharacterized repeat protein (TIGR01451 family)
MLPPSHRGPLWSLAFLLPVLFPGPAPAQFPVQAHAPLLFVRFAGPAGLQVTFYQGAARPQELPAPVTVGLRPGYLYRMRLTGLPGRPGVSLAPTLQVCGTLHLSPRLRAGDYPAPVSFSDLEIEQILRGVLLTKLVYLEDPERAAPVRADGSLELDVPPDRNLLEEVRDYGRPVLLIRVGQREVGNEELVRQSVPGTILLPGERVLPPPALKPWVPWAGLQLYDPHLGPKPAEEECLHDGGDAGRPVGLDREGRLHGLDPSDTVAEYADSEGRRHLSVSNRVCICVPRFAALRTELPPAIFDTEVSLAQTQFTQEQVQLRKRVPPLLENQNLQPGALKGRLRPSAAVATVGTAPLRSLKVLRAEVLELGPAEALCTKKAVLLNEIERTRLLKQIELARVLSEQVRLQGMEQVEGTAVVGKVKGLDVIRAVAETRSLTVCCNEAPRPPDKPLVLFKWADRHAAQVGDVVTFYLKYSNQGGQPITDVAVSDSLTGRLEYVPDSSRTDRDAVFTTQENEAGSLVLRWEISGRLLPGESGVVSFQARIR